jgi:arsenate reductase (thioredoxin)
VISHLKRVLFVCLGNSCRSQMAEGFARVYGSDVMIPASAGLTPANSVARDTVKAMDEKGISLREHFPKAIRHLGRARFDVVINMSGHPVSVPSSPEVRTWSVADPVMLDFQKHCDVRDEIERRVMELILEFRRASRNVRSRPSHSKPSTPSSY